MTVCDLRQAIDLNPRTLFLKGKAFPNIFTSPVLLGNMLIISNSSSQEKAGETKGIGMQSVTVALSTASESRHSVTVVLSLASESRHLHLI